MELLLRAGRLDDAEAVADLFLAARVNAMPDLARLHADDETRAWIRDVVVPQHELIVAEVSGRVVGFAALGPALLAHLYVRPDLQSRGIGGALLERSKELLPGGFRLWVFQRNAAARRFYEARGLRLVELTDGAANEEREPDALYEWRPGS